MKKQSPSTNEPQKGFIALAGEALHVLGEEIVEGKDKVVETAAEKFTQLKAAVGKLTHKKKAAPRQVVKKNAARKSTAKKTGKKVPKKKTARKVSRAK